MTRTDHYPFCWGCSLSVEGLNFDFALTGEILEAEYMIPERFQGAPGIAHGGIAAALLDEACEQVARQAISPSVTSRLELRYLAPVPVEEPLRISAQIVESEERHVTVEATISDSVGMVLAHARAECAHVRPEHFLSTQRGRARGLDWLPT
ncbi:MAG: PaaI family thioesterase [Actinomycetota bacterium]|nr:PaaI family thioesterase [Actinomycetota bacterium]